MSSAPQHGPKIRGLGDLAKLSLAALGVVYGDIGTSPLYAMKACFAKPHGVAVSPDNVLGILSLFFWSLTLVIGVKYLVFVMRADNHGEGGVLALLALLKRRAKPGRSVALAAYGILALLGAALLYGEAAITPVVSVLGAVEGLAVGRTELFTTPVIVAITIGILVALFHFQKRGTARVGAVFGPAMAVWFMTIAATGTWWITRQPGVLAAVDPRHAFHFFASHGAHGFAVLGAVVLCLTGGEALHTAMGHFGKSPIRAAWFFAAFPALLLNYFGQGALLLRAFERGDAQLASVVANPFYAMVDGWLRYPLIAVATVAAIIASQALISGAFSLTQSAVQLGYCPRVTVKHTSDTAEGQIYVPEVNAALMVGSIGLVLFFGESAKLAPAYGLSVMGTMSITSVLFYGVARSWGWRRLTSGAVAFSFLAVDLSFLVANAHKLAESTWVPIAFAAGGLTLMTTWHTGRAHLQESIRRAAMPLGNFLDLAQRNPHRVRGMMRISGTSIFLTSSPEGAPPTLLHYLVHHKVLHEKVVILSIQSRHVPEVAAADRIEQLYDLGLDVYQVVAAYGFMETPNVIELLETCRKRGLAIDLDDASYFLGRETLILTNDGNMAKWRKQLFSYMSRNARPANAFFRIPASRVVELGTHIEL